MSDKFHILTSLLLFSLGAPHSTPHPTGKGTQSTGKNMVAFGSIQHLPRGALSRTATRRTTTQKFGTYKLSTCHARPRSMCVGYE